MTGHEPMTARAAFNRRYDVLPRRVTPHSNLRREDDALPIRHVVDRNERVYPLRPRWRFSTLRGLAGLGAFLGVSC